MTLELADPRGKLIALLYAHHNCKKLLLWATRLIFSPELPPPLLARLRQLGGKSDVLFVFRSFFFVLCFAAVRIW